MEMSGREVVGSGMWDRAKWRGVVFMGWEEKAPVMALLFTDSQAAERILKGWVDLVGSRDENELIRIAIIEGDIAGKPPGYTVHIGADVRQLAKTARGDAKGPGPVVVSATRQQRMVNAQNSPHLAAFKEQYAKHGRFYLTGAVMDPVSGQPLLNPSCRIEKRLVHLRRSTEIALENDLDAIVLARPEGQGRAGTEGPLARRSYSFATDRLRAVRLANRA